MTTPITIPLVTQVDKLSPLNETLFQALRQGLVDLEACIDFILPGGTQIGLDLVTQFSIGPAAVGVGELKLLSEIIVLPAAGAGLALNMAFTPTTAAFYPTWVLSAATPAITWDVQMGDAFTSGGGTGPFMLLSFRQSLAQGTTITATINRVGATPPHRLGQIPDWGPFAFRKLDAAGKVIAFAGSEDPPWYLLAKGHLPKDHPAAVSLNPHPWPEIYDDQGNLIVGVFPGEKVQLLDMRAVNNEIVWSGAQGLHDTLVADRDQHLAEGVVAAELDAWIETYENKVAAEGTKNVKVWDLAMAENMAKNTSLGAFMLAADGADAAPLVPVGAHSLALQTAIRGAVEPLSAADVALLPTATAFTDAVEVVRPV